MTSLDLDAVRRWHKALLRERSQVDYLYARGVTLSVVEERMIGWDGKRLTFPVFDRDGNLVNVRRHAPRATEYKMLNTPGHGSPTRLYPLPLGDPDEWVIYGGGELDVLAAIVEGAVAVCGTNGEGAAPRAEDLDLLRGRRVALALDADDAGRKAAVRLGNALVNIAREVRVIALPEGSDLNDWFVSGRGLSPLLAMIERAPSLLPSGFETRRDPGDLVTRAVDKAKEGESRNSAGFWLAAQMRDERYAPGEAWTLALEPYRVSVEHLKAEPYRESEARASIASAYAEPPRTAVGRVAVSGFALTETGNAERLVATRGGDLRYLAAFDSWLIWNGQVWEHDLLGRLNGWAKASARSIPAEANGVEDEDAVKRILSWARASESRARLESTVKLARYEPGISMLPGQFDADPLSFNVGNGTLDLRAGSLRPHDRSDYNRLLANVHYDPTARAPQFDAFLRQIQPDPAVRSFLQRAVGYSLTGQTDEQKLLLLVGTGSNGKSTFVELMHDLMGPYSTFLPAEALMQTRGDRIPNDIARLAGSRFVSVMEFEDSAPINERLVKQLTGGDTISARYMRQEWFDFRPQCTIWVSTNHHPVVRGSDDGIWRRFLLVPFQVRIPVHQIDRDLRQRLRDTELPGILRWAVEGALEWQRIGLAPPPSIVLATDTYRADSDVLGGFVEDRCALDATATVSKAELYDEYKLWCRDNGLRPATAIGFGRMLRERPDLDITEARTGKAKTHVWVGLRMTYGGSDRRLNPPRVSSEVSEDEA